MTGEPVQAPEQKAGRRRRHFTLPLSTRRSVYDWTAMLLMLAPAALGIFLFGAVRMWSIGPLMIFSFTGLLMYALRPCLSDDLHRWCIPPAALLWALFWAYGWVRLPYAEVPYEARIELLKMGGWLLSYIAWTEMARYHKRWKILLGILLFLVTAMAWYAIIQHAHGSRMVLNLERPEVYKMRASGTYFCPNHFAALMEIAMPVALCLMFIRSAGAPLRLLAGYSLVVLLPVMILTQSRSGWIGTVVGLGATALLMALRKSRRAFLLVLLALFVILGGVGASLWTFSPMVRTRVSGALLSSPDAAVMARILMWKDCLPALQEHPVWGWGGASFHWIYPRFKTHTMQFFFNFLHNEPYQLLLEYGAVGLGLAAIILLYAAFRFLRLLLTVERDKDAFLVAGFCGSMAANLVHALFDYNFHIFSNVHLLMLVAGVTSAGLFSSGALPPRLIEQRPRRFLVSGLMVGVTALLWLGSLQVFASYGLHFLGEMRRTQFDMDRAVRRYEIARRLDPGNWRPWLGLGHVYQTRGFWDLDDAQKTNLLRQALGFYEEANRRNRCDMEVVFGLSKVWQSLGDPDKALALMRQTTEFEKNHLFYTTRLGLQLRRMGRDEEALQVFIRASEYGVANEMAVMNIQLLREQIAEEKNAAAQP